MSSAPCRPTRTGPSDDPARRSGHRAAGRGDRASLAAGRGGVPLRAAGGGEIDLGAGPGEPLTGDASTRRYERLHPAAGPSLIFMDQPPALESASCPPDATPAERAAAGYNALARLAAGRVDAFIATAGWLR